MSLINSCSVLIGLRDNDQVPGMPWRHMGILRHLTEVSYQLHAPAGLPPTEWDARWAPKPVWALRRRVKSLASNGK